jgi:hypothetical protein
MQLARHAGVFSLSTCLSLFLFCSLGFAIGQTPSTKQAEIVNLDANVYVSVEFEVRAGDKQLVIPVCRDSEAGGQSLCVGHLQRFIGGTWKNATPRKDMGGC